MDTLQGVSAVGGMPVRPRAPGAIAVGVPWALALGAVVCSRYRGRLDFYRGLHQWLADRGVSVFVRNLDYPLILLAGIVLAALAARFLAGVRFRDGLALAPGRRGWIVLTLAAAAPMVFGGLVLMLVRQESLVLDAAAPRLVQGLFQGVLQAPILEELLFRGVLVALPLAVLGDRARVFWPFAVAGGVCFGLIHATWTASGLAAGWINVLVAGIGGVWYAWLMRAWRTLFVPVLLHAAMNLGWMLAGSAGGAGGGGVADNLLRTATIAIATVWTIKSRARPGDERQ